MQMAMTILAQMGSVAGAANDWTIPVLLLIPLLGAAVTLLATPKASPKLAGPIALVASLVALLLVIRIVAGFPAMAEGATADTLSAWHFNCSLDWIPTFGVKLLLGMDTISLWLVVLTAVLTPVSILASFNYIKERQPEFYAWLLVLHTAMLGVFCARDVLLFYLFFEFTLIPMFFIIGIWGGAERRKAAGKFFLFTFSGSVLTMVALLYISFLNYQANGTLSFAMTDLYKFGPSIPRTTQYILFFGMLAGFAVKVPLFPVHTWLPLAHTEAPTAGSVILAGVLLKLGTYGILRFLLPILPDATHTFAPWIAGVCIVGIIYGALVSWVQGDMKKLIAYSSVSHLGFCVLGMFALTQQGVMGSVLYMINHGLSTGALFLVVGMIYERYHTRDMDQLSGLARRTPALGFFAVFFVMSSIALPGLNGFVSEFLVLLGTFVSGQAVPGHEAFKNGNLGPMFAIPAATGVILGAVYMLYWAGRVVYGPLKEPVQEGHEDEHAHAKVQDLSGREWAVLLPVAALVVVMGVYPMAVMRTLESPVAKYVGDLQSPANGNPVKTADASK
jgi:NADH-quinone oxidoreductase subunit M